MMEKTGVLFIYIFTIIIIVFPEARAEKSGHLVIGFTVSEEGLYKEPSLMMHRAFKLWLDEINSKGGILNKKVKMIVYNDRSNLKETEKLYKRLVEKDKVDIIFSPYSTPLTRVASKISEKHKMLMLAVAAASDKPWQNKPRYLFQLYAPAKRQFIGILDIIAQEGYKSISVLYGASSSFNMDVVRGIDEWSGIFKLKISYRKGFYKGPEEIRQMVHEIKTKNSDALILSAYPPNCYELINQLNKINYRPRILAMSVAPVHPDFYRNAGKTGELVLAPSQWEPSERIPFPGTKKFVRKFSRLYKIMPSFHAASAYASCQLYQKAIENAGSIDHRKFRDYIAALDTVTVLGRFKVDPSGMQIGHNSIVIQWQKGKKEIVWPLKMQTAEPVF